MIKKETITETKVVKTITCDFCGKESPYTYSGVKPCQICERDVCPHCAVEIGSLYDTDLLNPSCWGDYPEYICKSCWAKGELIRREIMQLREAHEDQEAQLIKNWEIMCQDKSNA